VVDLGSGTGQFALAVASSCRRVVAVDPSRDADRPDFHYEFYNRSPMRHPQPRTLAVIEPVCPVALPCHRQHDLAQSARASRDDSPPSS
jgi:hypothetical protein